MPVATDDFNRANAGDLGANWTLISQGFDVLSNVAVPHGNVFTSDRFAYYVGTWSNDQYAQGELRSIAGTGGGLGMAVRMSGTTTGNMSGYIAFIDAAGSGNVKISKFVAGAYSAITTRTTSWVDGDVLRMDVVGTTIRVYRNGVQLGADITDASVASGSPGMSFIETITSGNVDDWIGGDLIVFNPPVIDDFSGGDDADITGRVAVPGGQTWTSPTNTGHSVMQIVSGVLAGDAGDRSAVITSQMYGPNVQIAATIGTFASPRLIYLLLRHQRTSFPSSSATSTHYEAVINNTFGGAVRRIVAGVSTDVLTSWGGTTWASGYKFGLELIESVADTTVLTAYSDTGSGWVFQGASFDSGASRPKTAGYVSLELEATTSTLDDFRVQTIVAAAVEEPVIVSTIGMRSGRW